jgi:ABC-type transport system involved in multi-copper enzyme maturation permease subunit
MIWLTWRQFRTQVLVVAGVLAALAIVLAVTGPHLVSLSDAYLKSCHANRDCGSTTNPVLTADGKLENGLSDLLLLAPALIGIFWGAPLIARELETDTYRLGWTQSVSRQRWLAVKLGVVGLISVAVAGVLSLMVTWWSSPIDTANANRFGLAMFGLRDIAPIGYAAFAFALGVTAGVIIRRTLPAMAGTLVVFVVARVAEVSWVRPYLMPQVRTVSTLTSGNGIGFSLTPSGLKVMSNQPNIPNGWAISSAVVNNAGQSPSTAFMKSACPSLANGAQAGPAGGGAKHIGVSGSGPGPQAFQDCVAKVAAKYHEVVTYQPASRFWAFQGIETAIFLVAALLLVGLCFWWVRHRLS